MLQHTAAERGALHGGALLIGLFRGDTELFCGNIGLFCRYTKRSSPRKSYGVASALYFRKEPCISTEGLNSTAIFTKEPCISTKEPYISTKEPYISTT